MKEPDLRKWHRLIGTALALFIIIQAATGLILSLGQITGEHIHNHGNGAALPGHDDESTVFSNRALKSLHHGGANIGMVYRLLVGAGMLWMAGSGVMIFFKVLGRKKKR